MRPVEIGEDEFRMAAEVFNILPKLLLLTILAFLAWRSCQKSKWNDTFIILVAVHWGFVFLSTVFSTDELTYRLLGGQYRLDGLFYQTVVSLLIIFIYKISKENTEKIELIFYSIIIGGSLQSIIMIAQRFNFDPYSPLARFDEPGAPVGIFPHPGMAAGFLIVSLFLCFRGFTQNKFKLDYLIFTFLICLGLSISYNRTVFYAIILGVFFVNIVFRSKKVLFVSLGIISTIVFAKEILPNPQGFSRSLENTLTLSIRTEIWKIAAQVFPDIPGQPIIGGGADGFRFALLNHLPIDSYLNAYRLETAWSNDTQILTRNFIRREPIRNSVVRVTYQKAGDSKPAIADVPVVLDRAHSLIFDRVLSYGVINGIIWLILYGLPIYWLIRSIVKWDFTPNLVINVIILVIFLYYLVWFPVIQAEPIHLAMLAVCWAMHEKSRSGQEASPVLMTANGVQDKI